MFVFADDVALMTNNEREALKEINNSIAKFELNTKRKAKSNDTSENSVDTQTSRSN